MTIKVIQSIAKRHDIGVYDLEWHPDTMKLTLFGVNDGQSYRAFRTVEDGMEYMLQSHYAGKWWFAHNGGLADMAFLLEYFRKAKVEVNARFSGSSAVLVEARKRGSAKNGKARVWKFCDSFFLLRTKLEKIGKHLGLLKGETHDTELYYRGYSQELRDYNEQDCAILLEAVNQFQEQILGMGGEMKPTIAATALNLFKRRYLTDDIRTTDWVNDLVRNAYIASRVEVFRKYGFDLSQWDINSSFPSSMIHPTPGKLLEIIGNPRGGSINLPDFADDCWFAECTIQVPDMPIPPLPLRREGRVYFPTGVWKQWFSGPDLKLLEECGGKVLTAHQALKFEPRTDLRGYVQDIYKLRKESESPFEKEIYKLLMNALYGKWAEQAWKGSVLFNPANLSEALKTKYDENGFVKRRAEELTPGVIAVEERQDIEHEHVPFAAHITSNSRALITRYLWEAENINGEIPYYCDTDCVVMKGVLENSNELGKMKLEKEIKKGIFLAPKFYIKDDETRAKGFPRLSQDAFMHIADYGYAHRVERMARPKEIINDFAAGRRKDMNPRMLNFPKRLRLLPENSKRVFTNDGDQSRPFTVDEIDAGAGEHVHEWTLPEGWRVERGPKGFVSVVDEEGGLIHTTFNGGIET